MNSTDANHHVEIPTSLIIFKSTCLGILIILNITFNFITLVVLRRMRELSPTTKIFLTSMTVLDIGHLGYMVPIFLCTLMNRWPFGDTSCTINGYVGMVTAVLYYSHLPLVNLDRFIAVTRPYRYPSLVTVPRARAMVVCLWCISPVLAGVLTPAMTIHYQDIFHMCIGAMKVKDAIGMSIVTISPMALAILLFLRLFLVARGHAAAIDAQERVVGGNNNRSNELERKTFTTFLIMTACVTFCMTPQVIIYATESLKPGGPNNYWAVCLAQILSFSNTIINVIVYYWRTVAFRKAVYALMSSRQQ